MGQEIKILLPLSEGVMYTVCKSLGELPLFQDSGKTDKEGKGVEVGKFSRLDMLRNLGNYQKLKVELNETASISFTVRD